MHFKENAEVISFDMKTVGKIDRVVIHPATEKVTHLVVKKGMMFTTERVIPVEDIETNAADTVILKKSTVAPENYPEFEEKKYIATGSSEDLKDAQTRHAKKVIWYNIQTPLSGTQPYPGRDKPLFYNTVKQNIPEQTIALDEGAKVRDTTGKVRGHIKDIFVEPDNFKVTHIVVTGGALEAEKKLIPASWIKDITESAVDLFIGPEVYDRLPSADDGGSTTS